MPASAEVRAGKAYVELSLKNKLQKGMDAAEKRLKAFGANLTAIGKKVGLAGVAMTAPFAAAAFRFAQIGSDINDASQRLGISTDSVQELGFAAQLSGSSMEELEKGMAKMNIVAEDAIAGNETAAKSFSAIGIAVDELKGKDAAERFKLIAERLSQIQDPGKRAALAVDVLGKGAARLLPLLSGGAKGLAELTTEARRLNVIIPPEEIANADKLGDVIDTLKKQFDSLTSAVGDAVYRAIEPYIDVVTGAAAGAIKFVRENKGLIATLAGVAVGLVAVGGALITTGFVFSAAGTVIGGVVAVCGALATAVGVIASPLGIVTVAVTGALYAFLRFTETGQSVVRFLADKFTTLKDVALKTFGGITDALASGDMALAAKILWTGLQLAWAEGTHELRQKWIGFKTDFLKTAYGAFYGVQEAWEMVQSTLASGWTNTMASLQTTWANGAAFFVKLWHGAVNETTKAFDFLEQREREREKARIREDLKNEKITPKEAERQLADVDKQANKVLGDRDAKDRADAVARELKLQNDLLDIEEKRRKARELITQQRNAKLSELSGADQGEQQRLQSEQERELADLDKRRSQLQKDLDDLRKRAAQQRGTTPSFLDDFAKQREAVDKVPTLSRSIAVGTFSSSASALQSGGADANEKTAKNTADMKTLLQQVLTAVRNQAQFQVLS